MGSIVDTTDAPIAGTVPSPVSESGPGWLQRVRFSQWAHFLLLPLGGIDLEARSYTPLSLLRGEGIAFAVLSYGYLLNAATDRETDLDARKNPLLGDPRTRSYGFPVTVLAASALVLASLGPSLTLVATTVCILSGWLYSAGPRLKARPVIGTLLNVTNFAPLILTGLSGPPTPNVTALCIAFAALLVQNQLIHEAADAVEDAHGATRTTYRVLGGPLSALAVAGCGLCAAVRLQVQNASLSLVAVALEISLAIVIPASLALRSDDASFMKRMRLAHRWMALLAGALMFTDHQLLRMPRQ